MPVYITQADGQRMLFDTAKIRATFEGQPLDFMGARLDFYDATYDILDGTLGEDKRPVKILQIRDLFTGLTIEVPFDDTDEAARRFSGKVKKGRHGRGRRLRRS